MHSHRYNKEQHATKARFHIKSAKNSVLASCFDNYTKTFSITIMVGKQVLQKKLENNFINFQKRLDKFFLLM